MILLLFVAHVLRHAACRLAMNDVQDCILMRIYYFFVAFLLIIIHFYCMVCIIMQHYVYLCTVDINLAHKIQTKNTYNTSGYGLQKDNSCRRCGDD